MKRDKRFTKLNTRIARGVRTLSFQLEVRCHALVCVEAPGGFVAAVIFLVQPCLACLRAGLLRGMACGQSAVVSYEKGR